MCVVGGPQRKRAVTINDVAAAAGTSISTVSRAFHEPDMVRADTRDRALEAAAALGYTPNRAARGLITGRTANVGLVVPDVANPFFPALIKGAQARARARDHALLLVDTDEDPNTEAEVIRGMAKQVDGVIAVSAAHVGPRARRGRRAHDARAGQPQGGERPGDPARHGRRHAPGDRAPARARAPPLRLPQRAARLVVQPPAPHGAARDRQAARHGDDRARALRAQLRRGRPRRRPRAGRGPDGDRRLQRPDGARRRRPARRRAASRSPATSASSASTTSTSPAWRHRR